MSTINVLDASGVSTPIEKPLTPGRAAAASSRPVVLSTEDSTVQSAIKTNLDSLVTAANSTTPSPIEVGPFTVKNIAASQTNAVVGTTGAAGDYLSHIIIQPASTSPGAVTIYDGSTGGTNTTIYSFPGGASSLSNLAPLVLALPAKAVNAGWHVTTGASVSVTLVGSFT